MVLCQICAAPRSNAVAETRDAGRKQRRREETRCEPFNSRSQRPDPPRSEQKKPRTLVDQPSWSQSCKPSSRLGSKVPELKKASPRRKSQPLDRREHVSASHGPLHSGRISRPPQNETTLGRISAGPNPKTYILTPFARRMDRPHNGRQKKEATHPQDSRALYTTEKNKRYSSNGFRKNQQRIIKIVHRKDEENIAHAHSKFWQIALLTFSDKVTRKYLTTLTGSK